jgi:hypothetical protein
MICPFCGNEKNNTRNYCGNCGKKLPQFQPEIKNKKNQIKIPFFWGVLILFVILFAVVITLNGLFPSNIPSQPTTSYHNIPIATTQNPLAKTYGFNETANDGNLEITVLKSWDGNRIEGNNKEYFVNIKLKNLRADKKLQILNEDFLLIDSLGQQYPSGKYDFTHTISLSNQYGVPCGGSFGKCEATSYQSVTYQIRAIIPQNSQGLKLRFNFGGPSGNGIGGPFVNFDLTPQKHDIFDGYWCRVTDVYVNDNVQKVKNCYRFYSNGTYTHGDSLSAKTFGQSEAIVRTDEEKQGVWVNAKWTRNSNGQYEIFHNTFTYYGYKLEESFDPAQGPYLWDQKGVAV